MSTKQLYILRSTYITALATALLLILIFETDQLPKGTRAYDSQMNYVCEMIGVCLTIVFLPLSLKFMSFDKVKGMLRSDSSRYFLFSTLRLCMLTLPLIYNTTFYYLLGEDATLGYLALMTVIAFFFIWPSRGKMDYEMERAKEQQEK